MLGANVARGGLAAAGALVVAVLVGAIPAQGAGSGRPAGPAGPTGVTPTPTDTTTGSPSPTPTDDPRPRRRRRPRPRRPRRSTALLPDLVALPADELSIQIRKDGRRLRFSSSLGNIGVGPIEVRPNNLVPCPEGQHNSTQIIYVDGNANGRYNRKKDTAFVRHRAGCMVYHPLHHHWHFKASARYTLRTPVRRARPRAWSCRHGAR